MSTDAQYSPHLKQQIKELLLVSLYEGIMQRFKTRVDTLIEKNSVMCGYGHRSFVFRNTLYQNDLAQAPRPSNRLHPTLIPVMANYVNEFNALNNEEMPFVQGYFSRILSLFQNLEDCIELLPESLQPVMSRFIANYPSTAPRLSFDAMQKIKEENMPYLIQFKQYMVLHLIR